MSGLGRIATPDARDWTLRSAGIARIPEVAQPVSRYWPTPATHDGKPLMPLNQGLTPMCVGYTARGLLYSGPVYNYGGPDAPTIYHHAQLLDGIPGEAYAGTNARGALKYLQAQGYVSAYVWPHTVFEAVTMLQRGPIMAGVDWYTSFDHPGTTGMLTITPGASIRGGHEFLIIGYSNTYKRFRMINSWSRLWGQNGRAWLPFDVFTRLMNDGGDCCAPTEIQRPS